jgi:AcrR family transcriptional regulator
MTSTPDDHGSGGPDALVWERPTRERRERPTRDSVVAAAIELADTEGLDAVSIRRVAAALGARPMGLYSFFDRKDELIDLMIDHVLAETVLDRVPAGWRPGLSALARATRDVCMAHPWLVAATGMRAQIGPNAMRHFEQSLQAVADLAIDPAGKLAILRAADTYALGHVQVSQAAHEAWRRAGDGDRQRQETATAYLSRLAASGEFPRLAELGTAALLADEDDQAAFETGLNWLLAGIAADIGD